MGNQNDKEVQGIISSPDFCYIFVTKRREVQQNLHELPQKRMCKSSCKLHRL